MRKQASGKEKIKSYYNVEGINKMKNKKGNTEDVKEAYL